MVTLCLGGRIFSNNPKNTNSASGYTCTGLQLSVSSSATAERMKLFLLNTEFDAFSLQCRHHWVFNIYSLEKSEWLQVLTHYIYVLIGSVFHFLPLVYISPSQIGRPELCAYYSHCKNLKNLLIHWETNSMKAVLLAKSLLSSLHSLTVYPPRSSSSTS